MPQASSAIRVGAGIAVQKAALLRAGWIEDPSAYFITDGASCTSIFGTVADGTKCSICKTIATDPDSKGSRPWFSIQKHKTPPTGSYAEFAQFEAVNGVWQEIRKP